MWLLRVDFEELYRRHLRRHSQWGVNFSHLLAVAGTYLALAALLRAAFDHPLVVVLPIGLYAALLFANLRPGLWLLNLALVGSLAGVAFLAPPAPWWASVAAVVLFHRLQVWSHRVYRRELDMSEFQSKYPKGPRLFLLLALYELPILLHYLVFDRPPEPACE